MKVRFLRFFDTSRSQLIPANFSFEVSNHYGYANETASVLRLNMKMKYER